DRPVDAPKALLAPPDALVELRTECLDGSGELRGLHSDSLGDLAPECRILKSARWRTRVGPQRGLAEQRVRCRPRVPDVRDVVHRLGITGWGSANDCLGELNKVHRSRGLGLCIDELHLAAIPVFPKP